VPGLAVAALPHRTPSASKRITVTPGTGYPVSWSSTWPLRVKGIFPGIPASHPGSQKRRQQALSLQNGGESKSTLAQAIDGAGVQKPHRGEFPSLIIDIWSFLVLMMLSEREGFARLPVFGLLQLVRPNQGMPGAFPPGELTRTSKTSRSGRSTLRLALAHLLHFASTGWRTFFPSGAVSAPRDGFK